MTDTTWLDEVLDSVWDEACEMMEDGGTADLTRTQAKATILTKLEQQYRKGYNDNARDCTCADMDIEHKHLIDDGQSYNIRPDQLNTNKE
jgi:hypothetical protein